MIPKVIHIIWVGDESKRPVNCIQTWIDRNPDWQVKVWGNEQLTGGDWANARHMRELARCELSGVAALMRWEILYNEGGFVVDAESICIRALPDWLCENEAFACWENELARVGQISDGYVASEPGNRFIGQIVLDIQDEACVCDQPTWVSVGSQRLTDTWNRHKYQGLTLLPSYSFIPRHHSGSAYVGENPVYAYQQLGRTGFSYGRSNEDAVRGYRTERAARPRITVGMPTWNRADMIKEAIDAVLAQDYDNLDFLIVDDGSTDTTEQVVKAYRDSRIRYVKKEHSGLCATRNRVLAEATGEYVLWHDSDDALLPGVVSDYADMVTNWPEAVVVYGDLIQMDKEGNLGHIFRYASHGGDRHLLSLLFIQNALPMPGALVKTSVMRELGGFDEDLSASEDYDMWIRIAAVRGMFLHLGRPVCKYRWHGGNASFNSDTVMRADLCVLEKSLSRYPLSDLCSDLDWSHPRLAEVAAFSRAAMLMEARGGGNAGKPWRDHARSLLGRYTSHSVNEGMAA